MNSAQIGREMLKLQNMCALIKLTMEERWAKKEITDQVFRDATEIIDKQYEEKYEPLRNALMKLEMSVSVIGHNS